MGGSALIFQWRSFVALGPKTGPCVKTETWGLSLSLSLLLFGYLRVVKGLGFRAG